MKLENFRLRLRLSEIETQLLKIDDEVHPWRAKNSRLKKERQRRLLEERTVI
ncbi:hypothetical protein DFH07DRAFT_893198 [Mycena maculata]|uniref:Uncharacterized protein n=1 Tax=Mycena maculata TaxID=230809 RepID=A0AAD7I8P4_9AGAR|nr:hypothetical protein DFH07DRAFT_893198 [Mycena maculata]